MEYMNDDLSMATVSDNRAVCTINESKPNEIVIATVAKNVAVKIQFRKVWTARMSPAFFREVC
jgi:hypothetical protein